MCQSWRFGFVAAFYTLSADGFRLILLHRATKQAGSITLKTDFYHAFIDLLSTGIAFTSLWLVTIGFYHGDSFAAIALGGFLGYLSSTFAYRSAMELTYTILPKLVSRVKEAIDNNSDVLECKDLKMRLVGRESFIEVTVYLRTNISFKNAHKISTEVERNIVHSIDGNPNIMVHLSQYGVPIYR
jgi:divalent metal cation (Fe/Co/Zn/Cd) transporter